MSLTPDLAARASHPHAITDPKRVPAQRYYSAEFAQLEKQKLWQHVWQVACRLEDLPETGDYIEYEINDESILVVRESDSRIKAYHNACRHRATALGNGSGTFHGRQIVCPYHGWRWDLNGENTYVYAAKRGFTPACLDKDNLRLREVQVDSWGGMVFVNMDAEAPPLEEYLEGITKVLDPIAFERMRVRWWRHVILPCNWKMAQEAFLEAYHVMQAHPSLAMGAADDDFNLDSFIGEFECFEGGHAHSRPPTSGEVPVKGMSWTEYFVQYNNALYFGTDAFTTEREMFIQQGLLDKDIPDEEFPAKFFEALYTYAQEPGFRCRRPRRTRSGTGTSSRTSPSCRATATTSSTGPGRTGATRRAASSRSGRCRYPAPTRASPSAPYWRAPSRPRNGRRSSARTSGTSSASRRAYAAQASTTSSCPSPTRR